MKAAYVIMLVTVTLGLSVLASADSLPSNDPAIKTGGPLAASSVAAAVSLTPTPSPIVTANFVIQSPSGTSPDTSPCILIEGSFTFTSPMCYFQNDINPAGVGQTITQLTFDAFGISPSTVTCGELSGSPFTTCSVDAIAGGTEVDFTGGSIPFDANFTLEFDGFPQNFESQATATAAPEPCTMALLLAGLGSLAIRRKRS